MKIAIYDGILETHVASSLERAMIARGHEVFNTGKIGHGFKFVSDPLAIQILNSSIDDVLSFDPDLVIVFRPASLPHAMLERLRSRGATLWAWFSDDPVLWKLSYGPVVDNYDLILHCGTAEVLDFYEKQHGRPTGINFPFWTDNEAFPMVYRRREAETDALFLGNVHDKVRRQRYFDLANSGLNLRIHGGVGSDYFNLWGGYLDSDEEVIDAGSRTRLAINIPQFFRDHEGLETWFGGLGGLGFFQYPSRVIQYAAMGIPQVSVVPNAKHLETFPEIVCVPGIEELGRTCRSMLDDSYLADLSHRTYQRFESHFSAMSRALAIEALMRDETSWRSLDVQDRANWFTQFDGSLRVEEPETAGAPKVIEVRESTQSPEALVQHHYHHLIQPHTRLRVALLGTGWANQTSAIRTSERALNKLGHDVVAINPFPEKAFFHPDKLGEFRGIADVVGLDRKYGADVDAWIFVGTDYLPHPLGVRELKKRGVSFINHANAASKLGMMEMRLASLMDVTALLNSMAVEAFDQAGLRAEHVPDLVDRSYLRLQLMLHQRVPQVGVIAERETHIGSNRRLIDDFKEFQQRQFVCERDGTERHALADIARTTNSLFNLVLPDSSRKGPLPNRLLGHALFSGAVPVIVRGLRPSVITTLGVDSLGIAVPGEFHRKVVRFADNQDMLLGLRRRAVQLAIREFAAEERLESLLRFRDA